MRVFLDTNVIVSAVTTRGLCADVFRAVLTDHELVTSAQVLREVRRVLKRKFAVPGEWIEQYLELICQAAIVAEHSRVAALPIRDEDDRKIVAAAIHAKAQVLVTGDMELQSLRVWGNLMIISPRAFWDELKVPARPKP